MKINIAQKSRKRIIATIIIACALGVVAYLTFAYNAHHFPFAAEQKANDPTGHEINLNRSEAEKQKTQDLLDNPTLKTENDQTDIPPAPSTTSSSGRHVVSVLLTNADIVNGIVRASGFATNIVEDGGECVYTFTNGSSVIVKKSGTLQNPTSTTCETVTFNSNELESNGIWKVVLSYSSLSAEGVYNTKELTK